MAEALRPIHCVYEHIPGVYNVETLDGAYQGCVAALALVRDGERVGSGWEARDRFGRVLGFHAAKDAAVGYITDARIP